MQVLVDARNLNKKGVKLDTELDAATQSRLDRGYRMVEILKQPQYKPMNVIDQIMIIYAGNSGALDKVGRMLAQRSAQAAKEIKGLITTSVEKVQSGSLLVKDAGDTMGEIVASVQRVTDIIGEITAAAVEQSEGIAQVNVTVNQLDQMTQQNAALVEQSTAAAESLRDQAHRLIEVVSVFRVGGQDHLTVAAAPARPAPRPASPPAALPRPAAHAQAAAPKLGKVATNDSKNIAYKASGKSEEAKKNTKSSVPLPVANAAATPKPLSVNRSVGAAKPVAKPADDSGDWETF